MYIYIHTYMFINNTTTTTNNNNNNNNTNNNTDTNHSHNHIVFYVMYSWPHSVPAVLGKRAQGLAPTGARALTRTPDEVVLIKLTHIL